MIPRLDTILYLYLSYQEVTWYHSKSPPTTNHPTINQLRN